MDTKPSAFVTSPRDKRITLGETQIQYEIIPLTNLSKNERIKFEPKALVVFAGCNTGCRLTDIVNNKDFVDMGSVAESFTGVSGIASIGSMGYTYPEGTVRKVQNDKDTPFKEGYYLFQKKKDGTVTRDFIGDSLTKEVIEKAKKIVENEKNK